MSDKPAKFEDLGVEELRRSAVEDFAVDVDPKDSKKSVLAALLESGVKWADYVAQHPEVAPEKPVDRQPEVSRGNVITSDDFVSGSDNALTVEEEDVVIRVKEEIPVKTTEKYLVKMVRDNPLFEAKGHRFTQEHPYALVSASVANYLIEKEEGFRQATPSELQEYYG